MKEESIENELKLIKLDYLNMQKNMQEMKNRLSKEIDTMKEHIAYIYGKLELKIPERKNCMECNGTGKAYVAPIRGSAGIIDFMQSDACGHCNGFGFKYL